MRRIVLLLLAMVVAGCQTTSTGPDAQGTPRSSTPAGDARQSIPPLLDQYTQALMKKDMAALQRLWADDLVFINPRGQTLTKAQRLENVRTGSTAFRSIDVADVSVHPYGEVAACTSRVTLNAQYSGQEGSGTYRVAMVWTRPKGMWQMSLIQMTRMDQ